MYYDDIDYDLDYDARGLQFADPCGVSALRASSAFNPRDCSCPTCQRPNMLTRQDVRLGYQCDICADAAERAW